MKGQPTCDTCYGTGLWRGFGAPCDKVGRFELDQEFKEFLRREDEIWTASEARQYLKELTRHVARTLILKVLHDHQVG